MKCFTSTLVLSVPDPDLQFIVDIDASEVRVGVVLSLLSPHRGMVHLFLSPPEPIRTKL